MDPIKYIEEEYPETAKSFKEIQKEQYELFCKSKWITAQRTYQLELI